MGTFEGAKIGNFTTKPSYAPLCTIIYVPVSIFEIGITIEWETKWHDAYNEHMKKIEVYD